MNLLIELFHSILNVSNIILPIFLVLFLGTMLRRKAFLTEEFSSRLNSFVFYVSLPCMIVYTIAHSTSGSNWIKPSLVILLTTSIIALLAYAIAKKLKLDDYSIGSFIQATFRSNNAYIGIPVIAMAYAGDSSQSNIASLAMLTLAPCLIFYNVLAVIVLSKKNEKQPINRIFISQAIKIAKNPLIIACIIGSTLFFTKLHLPSGIDNTINMLGKMATPGALLALGSSITNNSFARPTKTLYTAIFLKLIACPLIAFLIATLFSLKFDEIIVIMIFMACPSAVASFVMAKAMNANAKLAGDIVTISTIYSFISLGLVLLFKTLCA